jgi:CheY-like chemotaxis protein
LEYQVVIARSGTEALEKARRLQPCLILLSPDLPMLSGWDVLALLKGDAITQHIRMVMMKRANEPRINSNQADGILIKPIQAAELSAFLPDYLSVQKPLKFMYLNQNIDSAVINLIQVLGHCLLEVDDLPQCDVLSKIWMPDLFLLDGDNKLLLKYLEDISQLNMLTGLPILMITKSAIAEIGWLQKKFPNLSLRNYISLDLTNLDTNRAEILMALHQSINNAICYVTSPTLANSISTSA